MSGGAAQRRQRILAVRVRQTRIAQVRLAEAHRKLERLEGTAEQLANMALSLTKSPGETSGLALRAIGEMGERLGTAAYQMRTPIADAAIERDQRLTVMSGASKASSAIGSVNSLAGQSLAALAANDSAPADPAGFAEDLLAALGSATQQLAASTVEAAPATSAADALQAKLPDLDMSKESAWLDRLARDIAATAGDNGKLSFRLVPPQLGKLDISIETRSEGVAVQMTAETREARNIIAAAQPKLTEALGAQGVRVAEASVTSGRGEEMPRNRHLTPIQLIETAHDREADAEPQRPQRAAGRFA
jgi:flagellar hook-length control protein FliK